jgi:hypothetical protein
LDEELLNSPEVQLQKNHFHQLHTNFAPMITKFQGVQAEIKSKFVKQVTRHFNIAELSSMKAW